MESDSLLIKAQAILYGAGSLLAGIMAESPQMSVVLLVAMAADWMTGLLAAVGHYRGWSSSVGWKGLAKKAAVVVLCFVVWYGEREMELVNGNVASVVMGWFAVNETISILENLVLLKVPFPRALLRLLVVGRDRLEKVLGDPSAPTMTETQESKGNGDLLHSVPPPVKDRPRGSLPDLW